MNEFVQQRPSASRRRSISLALPATLLTSGILLAAPARDAAAACQDGTTVQAIPPSTAGGSLQTIMALSTKPCTLNLAPATYTAPAGTAFIVTDGITLRGVAGAAATFLQAAPAQPVTLFVLPINGSCPSGATVEGLTLSGGAWGVLALAGPTYPGCPFNLLTDITLRNLVVNTGPGDGNAIYFQGVQHSVIDSCWINSAFANGIYLPLGSDHNIVMNNTIVGSFGQHAIAVQSNDNVIVGNLINVVTSFDGIILNSGVGLAGPGGSRNRIERNTIMGHKVDGIVLTDASGSNYVGLNTAVSGSYPPGSSTPLPGTVGTGIWVNNASNANYLYGNDLSGSPENGIDVLASRSTLLVANTVHGNYHGGIWVAYYLAAASPSAPAPQDTVLHGNNIFFNGISRQLFLQSTISTQAAFNYLSGAQAGVLSSDGTVGIAVQDSASATIFENTVSEVWSRAIVQGVTDTQFFRNRFLKGINTPTFSFPPADVRWDAGSVLGGNHWSDFPAAAGNPDPGHPYAGFIGNTGAGPYVDRFPFASDTLQTAAIPNSITVVEPVAGAVLAAETRKTIRWVGRGCSSVHLYYGSWSIPPVLIAARYPSTGYYIWNVPSVVFGSDYYVLVQCLDANGVWLGPIAASTNLTIGSNHLVLLNPGRGTRANDGGVLRVAWRASAAVAGVNVFVKSGSGAEIQVATNVTGASSVDIILPAFVSSSSLVTVRIQDSGNGAHQDSVDGSFMVRGPAPSFHSALSNTTIRVGSVQLLQWTGPATGYTVDIDLIGQGATPVARNLPDFGTFSWFVPDAASPEARLHATFKDENGNAVGVLDSGTFSIAP
jgi:parallel beta-helix repeat protein